MASAFGVNVNELFAAQGIVDHRGFLRLHIGSDGSLTIYPIGVDVICHTWAADPQGAPDASWRRPETPLTARLIEEPIPVAGPHAIRP